MVEKCCDVVMELKAVTKKGVEQSRKYGLKTILFYHFQCKKCGKTKITEVRK